MSFQSVNVPEPLLISPPLKPPLVLRTRFGAVKLEPGSLPPKLLLAGSGEPPCSHFIDEDEPYSKFDIHEAIDLESAGCEDIEVQDADGNPATRTVCDCVFAVAGGTIVDRGEGGAQGNIVIDHHPRGQGLVSKYVHLDPESFYLDVGDQVTRGQLIGALSPETPNGSHLHLELRNVVNRGCPQYWTRKNSIALDPTRLLYRWEAVYRGVLPINPPDVVVGWSVERLAMRLPFFRAYMAGEDVYSIPLYEPLTEQERQLMKLFKRAQQTGAALTVEHLDSVFFAVADCRVPVAATMA